MSGIKTQGFQGKPFWVEAFQISFSNDGITWITIQNDKGNTNRVFLGNYDANTVKTQYFDNMIHARYLKVHPVKWNNNIGMRLELIGCYKPYIINNKVDQETTELPILEKEIILSECKKCPGLDEIALTNVSCQCTDGLTWDGRACVPSELCPCYYGSMR